METRTSIPSTYEFIDPYYLRTPLLTDEFAETVRQVGGQLPDETRLRDLFVLSNKSVSSQVHDRMVTRRLGPANPPEEWSSFLGMLDPKSQKGPLMRTVNYALRSRYQTIGEIRQATYDELTTRGAIKPYSLTPRSASFLKRAFEPLSPLQVEPLQSS